VKPFNQSPAHRLRSAYLRMHRVTNRVFRPFGVTADQYVVLRLLAEGDSLSQQELARLAASDPTTLGRMLDLLEQKQFVARRPHETDRRTRLVFLTDEGRRMVEKLYEAALPIRDTIDSAVSDTTMKTLLRGLLQLGDACEKLDLETTPPIGSSPTTGSTASV